MCRVTTSERLPADRSVVGVACVARRAVHVGAEGGELDADTEQRINRARSQGSPLDANVRRSIEGMFGADFSSVRTHVNAASDTLNDDLQARAFTSGSDIFVRRSDYSPNTERSQAILAHELERTLQQRDQPIGRLVRRTRDGESESESDGPARGYPGFDALEEYAQVQCLEKFETYGGISAFDSTLFYSWIVRSIGSWNSESKGRQVACVADTADGSNLIGAVENSRL